METRLPVTIYVYLSRPKRADRPRKMFVSAQSCANDKINNPELLNAQTVFVDVIGGLPS
jgi:hypothetical protein